MNNSKIQKILNQSGTPSVKSSLAVVFFLAWPAIVEQFMITMVQYVDTALVGALGPAATAAVGLTATTTWLFNGFFNAASVGFSVQVAQKLGANNEEDAKKITWQALRFIVVFGVIVSMIAVALSFPLPSWLGASVEIQSDASLFFRIMALAMPFTLGVNMLSAIIRCSGNTRTPMILNVTINVINVILNILFIYPTREVEFFSVRFTMWGLGLGVGGSATASAISTVTVFTLFLIVLFKKKSPIQISFKKRYKFEKICLSAAVKLGLPVALERSTLCIAQIVITVLITGIGTVAIAANHLAVTAEAISYLPAYGVAMAGTTLVGQAIGAKRKDIALCFAKTVTFLGIGIMTLGGVILFVFAPQLISIFSSDPEVIELGIKVLRIVAFAEPLFGAAIVVTGALRGAGDSKAPFFICLATMWGVRIVLALILVSSLGLIGVWIAMAVELCARGIIFMIRLYSKKWLNIQIYGEAQSANS